MVRAKVKVRFIQIYESGRLVKMEPVGGGNESYSKYTPSGSLELSITNPEAYEQFVVGGEYYVDFTPVDGVKAGAQ